MNEAKKIEELKAIQSELTDLHQLLNGVSNATTLFDELQSTQKLFKSLVSKQLLSNKNLGEIVISFELGWTDIIHYIHLINNEGKVVQCVKLNDPSEDKEIFLHHSTGYFILGDKVPAGDYRVELVGCRRDVFRGKLSGKKKELSKIESITKDKASDLIHVLIDFDQESPFDEIKEWLPKQDNTHGREFTVKKNVCKFGVKEIILRKASDPLSICGKWEIDPADFKGTIKVKLTEKDFDDDIYYFELIGYNEQERNTTLPMAKIDEVTYTLNWEVKLDPIVVKMDIDFDPRQIYFMNSNGEEYQSYIYGERPHLTQVEFISNDVLTKKIPPGEYRIRISGVEEDGHIKVQLSASTYKKGQAYSRFKIILNQKDDNLRGERDIHLILDHLKDEGERWLDRAFLEIKDRLLFKFKSTDYKVQGLISYLQQKVPVSGVIMSFGGSCKSLAEASELIVTEVVKAILKHAENEAQRGKPSIEDILSELKTFIADAKSKKIYTDLFVDDQFISAYLDDKQALTTQKLLLQITKDIDILIVGMSLNEFVNKFTK